MESSRRATEADVPRLAELAEAALAELRVLRGGDTWAATRASDTSPAERFAAALADPNQTVLAGTIDDVVVGYAAAHVEVLGDGRRIGVIDDLYVEEGARSVGVGEALMADVMAWCRARRCRGVDATALPGHRATKNFLEESGFTARLLVLHRSLDDEVGG